MTVRMTGLETGTQHADVHSMASGSAVVTTPVRTGVYAMRSLSDAAEPLGVRLVSFGTSSDLACRFYMRVAVRPTVAPDPLFQSTWYILSMLDGTSLGHPTLILTDTGKLAIVHANANIIDGVRMRIGSTVIPLADFNQRVEWRINAATGLVQAFLNGTQEISYTDPSLLGYDRAEVGGAVEVNSGNTGGDAYFDDILARNNTVLPGAGQHRIFVPTRDSNVGYTGWTPSAGADDWAVVDDAIPTPDDTDYISSTTALQKGTVRPNTASALGIDGTIHAISALVRGGGDGVNQGGGRILMNINGVDTLATTDLFFVPPVWFSAGGNAPVVLMGPFFAADWDTVEGGFRKTNDATQARVHTVWFAVDWQPSPVGPSVFVDMDFIAGSHAFQPADGVDTYIGNQNPTTNFDSATALWVGLASGGKDPNEVRRTLINFTPGLAAGDTVRQARLCLSADISGISKTYRLSKILRAWAETAATWNAWATGSDWTTAGCGSDGNDFTSVNPNQQETTYASQIQDLFIYLLCANLVDDAKTGTVRIRIINTDEASLNVTGFAKSETLGDTRLRPILVAQVDIAPVTAASLITPRRDSVLTRM